MKRKSEQWSSTIPPISTDIAEILLKVHVALNTKNQNPQPTIMSYIQFQLSVQVCQVPLINIYIILL